MWERWGQEKWPVTVIGNISEKPDPEELQLSETISEASHMNEFSLQIGNLINNSTSKGSQTFSAV